MRRELMLEANLSHSPEALDNCPVFVPLSCNMPPGNELEAGDNVLVHGYLVPVAHGKGQFIRIIAEGISRVKEGRK
jgi:hypothetical protein